MWAHNLVIDGNPYNRLSITMALVYESEFSTSSPYYRKTTGTMASSTARNTLGDKTASRQQKPGSPPSQPLEASATTSPAATSIRTIPRPHRITHGKQSYTYRPLTQPSAKSKKLKEISGPDNRAIAHCINTPLVLL